MGTMTEDPVEAGAPTLPMGGGPAEDTLELPPRYTPLGIIGRGGMGVVYRVHDSDLNCVLALKVLRSELMARPDAVARFVQEAQATAQLQHAGIVPVYERGRLPGGALYFRPRPSFRAPEALCNQRRFLNYSEKRGS